MEQFKGSLELETENIGLALRVEVGGHVGRRSGSVRKKKAKMVTGSFQSL